MDDKKPTESEFSRQIRQKEIQKVNARKSGGRSIWLGIGMFGIVGWSITIPTILGAFLGIWLDKNYPGKFSYTLALLVGGLVLGCFNVAYWIGKENRQIHEDYSGKRQNPDLKDKP
jgi:ATP synthase protein I